VLYRHLKPLWSFILFRHRPLYPFPRQMQSSGVNPGVKQTVCRPVDNLRFVNLGGTAVVVFDPAVASRPRAQVIGKGRELMHCAELMPAGNWDTHLLTCPLPTYLSLNATAV